MPALPLSEDPHGDYLNQSIGDDTAARDDRVYCTRNHCGEQVTRDNECPAMGVDPERPRCGDCCDCEDCASDRCSDQHTPGIGQWFAA